MSSTSAIGTSPPQAAHQQIVLGAGGEDDEEAVPVAMAVIAPASAANGSDSLPPAYGALEERETAHSAHTGAGDTEVTRGIDPGAPPPIVVELSGDDRSETTPASDGDSAGIPAPPYDHHDEVSGLRFQVGVMDDKLHALENRSTTRSIAWLVAGVVGTIFIIYSSEFVFRPSVLTSGFSLFYKIGAPLVGVGFGVLTITKAKKDAILAVENTQLKEEEVNSLKENHILAFKIALCTLGVFTVIYLHAFTYRPDVLFDFYALCFLDIWVYDRLGELERKFDEPRQTDAQIGAAYGVGIRV